MTTAVTGAETLEDKLEAERRREAIVPAIVLIFAAGKPCCEVVPVRAGAPVRLGRDKLGGRIFAFADGHVRLADGLVSGHHADVSHDGEAWTVRDNASRNSTYVEGQRVDGSVRLGAPTVLRVGGSIFLFVPDSVRFRRSSITIEGGRVRGLDTSALEAALESAARAGMNVLISGESGTGKEAMARRFHLAGPHCAGPFIDVNCAAIPLAIAEAELFGVRKGAFSGATADRPGIIAAADGGTLFLDEVGELELSVQAKLLRVLETRRVQAVGATTQRAVQVLICAATLRDLEAAVERGSFRADLLARLAQRPIELAPLRSRREEIPFFVQLILDQVGCKLPPSARFVEACVLRSWAGRNVRMLTTEVTLAAEAAGLAEAPEVSELHLRPERVMSTPPEPTAPLQSSAPVAIRTAREQLAARLLEAYKKTGNAIEAGKLVGLKKSRAYELLTELGVRPRKGDGETDGEA